MLNETELASTSTPWTSIFHYLFFKILSPIFAVNLFFSKVYNKIVGKWNLNFIAALINIRYITNSIALLFLKEKDSVDGLGGNKNCTKKTATKVGTALNKFKESISEFKKVPKHVGIVITPEESINPELNLNLIEALSKQIGWIYLGGINSISVFDIHGILKSMSGILSEFIQHEIKMNAQILGKDTKLLSALKIRVNIDNQNPKKTDVKEQSGVLMPADEECLNIYVLSYTNGKYGYVNTIKQELTCCRNPSVNATRITSQGDEVLAEEIIGDEFEKNAKMASDSKLTMRDRKIPNENELDKILSNYLYKSNMQFEPDLLIIHGNIYSTFGFLPWHIRLTEFFWTGDKLNKFSLDELTQILLKYSQVNQKLGK